MATNRIDLSLSTKYDRSGMAAVKRDVADLNKAVTIFGQGGGSAVKRLTDMVKGMLAGGVWTIAAAAIMGVVTAVMKWRSSTEEAAKAAEAAVVKAAEKQKRALDDYAAAAEKAAKASISATDENLKRINAEVDATNKLAKATLELARDRARAAGDTEKVAEAERQLAALSSDTGARKAQAQRDAFDAREQALLQQQRQNASVVGGRSIALDQATAARAKREAEIRAEAERNAVGDAYTMQSSAGAFTMYRAATAAQRAAAGEAAVAAFRKTADYETMTERIKEAQKAVKDAQDKSAEIRRAIAGVQAERANFETEQVAAAVSAEAAAAKKIADEKEKADIEAAKKAAAERERLDRELHAKRMADLRAEIDAQKGAASGLKARAAAAQSEFDRAFALFRSPEAAANQRAEEESYRADLNRLHKSARRYGGQWRIDELSALMAAGDTQGVSDTLAGWRRSRSFTPEVEAMVRASAAERTKTTTEDELRKIENNTAQLATKLDELLQVKGGANG